MNTIVYSLKSFRKMWKSLVFLVTLFSGSFGAFSFIKKCMIDDEECMKTTTQESIPYFMSGLPELEIEVLDPEKLDNIEFEQYGLKFALRNGETRGWKNVVVDKLKVNREEKTIYVEFHCALQTRGDYSAEGQLHTLPFSGEGEMRFDTEHTNFKVTASYEKIQGTDDSEYLRLKDYKMEFDETVGAHYWLSHLFDDDKDKGDNMMKFLKENWRVITNQYGGPVFDFAFKKLYTNIDRFFNKVPLRELVL